MRVVGPALLIIAVAVFAAPQTPAANSGSVQVIQFLNQTVDWYRHVALPQQTAAEPDDFMLMSDNGRMANQIVRLAFDFARAEVGGMNKQGSANADLNQGQSESGGSSALLQLEAKLDKQTEDDETEMRSLRQKLEAATGGKHRDLQS